MARARLVLVLGLAALAFFAAATAHASSSHRADAMLAAAAGEEVEVQHRKEGAHADGIFGDLWQTVTKAASSIVKKASIAAKMQVLVDAIQAASPNKIAKIPDDVVRQTIQDKLEQTAEAMVKQTQKDQNKLPDKGIDKNNAGADKKPASGPNTGKFLEVSSSTQLLDLELDPSPETSASPDPLQAEAKKIVADAKVKAAIVDLGNALVDENADSVKIPKDKSVENLTDKVTAAVVALLQRGDDNGAKKIGASSKGDPVKGAASAVASAAASAATASSPASSSPAVAGAKSGDPSFATPRFGNVFAVPRFRRMFASRAQAPNSVTVELSAKSYIRPLSSKGCWVICPDIRGYVIDPVCSGAAIAFCASMGTVGVLADSESYGSGGNFRLYSKITFKLTCENGKVTSVSVGDKEGKVGKEGPLEGQPPNGDYDRIVAKVENGEGHLGYMFSGRPHRAAEPGFQLLKFRTCTWIWHFPYYKIKQCNADGSWSGEYQFGGSYFPTRRLWQGGREIDTIQQGRIDALWNASSRDRALVDGWFPYNFPY